MSALLPVIEVMWWPKISAGVFILLFIMLVWRIYAPSARNLNEKCAKLVFNDQEAKDEQDD